MTRKYNVYFITDCTDDAAHNDVETATRYAAERVGLDIGFFGFQGVTPFCSEELSYAAAHRVLTNDTLRLNASQILNSDILILNAAPPKSALGKDAGGNNERENFVFGMLDNGAYFAGTINGLSLLKPLVSQLYEYCPSNSGTQFRSRDVLPTLALATAKDLAHLACHKDVIKLDPSVIPDFPDDVSRVVHIDNFGTAKIRLTESDRQELDYALKHHVDGHLSLVYPTEEDPVTLTGYRYPSRHGNQGPIFGEWDRTAFPEFLPLADKPGDTLVALEFKLRAKLFDGDEGENVCTPTSSSQIYKDPKLGTVEDIGQFTTIRRQGNPRLINFPRPRIGGGVGIITDGGAYAM